MFYESFPFLFLISLTLFHSPIVSIVLDQIPSQNCMQIFNRVVKGLIRSRLNPTSKAGHAYMVSFSIKFDSFMKHQTLLPKFELRAFQLITIYKHKDRWQHVCTKHAEVKNFRLWKILHVKLEIFWWHDPSKDVFLS